MGNIFDYTTKVLEYGYKLPDDSPKGTVADLKTVPVRFSVTFHNLDKDQLDRILNANKKAYESGLIKTMSEAEVDAQAQRQCDEYYDYAYGLPVK